MLLISALEGHDNVRVNHAAQDEKLKTVKKREAITERNNRALLESVSTTKRNCNSSL